MALRLRAVFVDTWELFKSHAWLMIIRNRWYIIIHHNTICAWYMEGYHHPWRESLLNKQEMTLQLLNKQLSVESPWSLGSSFLSPYHECQTWISHIETAKTWHEPIPHSIGLHCSSSFCSHTNKVWAIRSRCRTCRTKNSKVFGGIPSLFVPVSHVVSGWYVAYGPLFMRMYGMLFARQFPSIYHLPWSSFVVCINSIYIYIYIYNYMEYCIRSIKMCHLYKSMSFRTNNGHQLSRLQNPFCRAFCRRSLTVGGCRLLVVKRKLASGYLWRCQKRWSPCSVLVAFLIGCTPSAGPLWCSVDILVIRASPRVASSHSRMASAEGSESRQRMPIVQQWNLGLDGLPSTGL